MIPRWSTFALLGALATGGAQIEVAALREQARAAASQDAAAAVAQARSAEAPALLAEALLVEGQARQESGDHAGARERLEEARELLDGLPAAEARGRRPVVLAALGETLTRLAKDGEAAAVLREAVAQARAAGLASVERAAL